MRTPQHALASLLVLVSMGCVAAPDQQARSAFERRLAELERRADPLAILDWAAAPQPAPQTAIERARLELARGRALARSGRGLSARGAYQAAWNALDSKRNGALGAEILRAWGDADVAFGSNASASKRYGQALALGDLPRDLKASLLARQIVLAEIARDTKRATALRAQLGRDAPSLVAAASREMRRPTRAASAPPVASVRALPAGMIPQDPRELLASIHPRLDWGARPIGVKHDPMAAPRVITVHHSAMDPPALGSTAAQLRRIQDMHTQDNGWADIGYHYLIDPAGDVWEGRALQHQGAHSGGQANVANIGVCLLGNFDRQTVPRVQLDRLLNLLDTLRRHFGVPAASIRTHREFKATECPGRFLQAAVEAYRTGAAATVARQ